MIASWYRILTDRAQRKLGRSYGSYLCHGQSNPLGDFNKTVVTTFYDVEGDYAIPGKREPCLKAIESILEIEHACGVRSTYNIVAKFALETPDLIAEIQRGGHEIASHSYDHKLLNRLSAIDKLENVRHAKTAFRRLGIEIGGHRSPQSAWDQRLMKQLVREGYAWDAENGPEPYPYVFTRWQGKALWRFPVRDDDWWYEGYRLKPDEVLEKWKGVINRARERKQYTAIGFHPWVEVKLDRFAVFEEFMGWLTSIPDVVVMPFGKVLEVIEGCLPVQQEDS